MRTFTNGNHQLELEDRAAGNRKPKLARFAYTLYGPMLNYGYNKYIPVVYEYIIEF